MDGLKDELVCQRERCAKWKIGFGEIILKSSHVTNCSPICPE